MLYSLPTELNTTSHSQTCRNNGFKITRAAPTASHITPYPGRASHARRACAWLPILLQSWAPGKWCPSPSEGLLSCATLSAQSRPTQGASQQRGVYPGPTCCLSGAGLPLQCRFRGCSHLSWAVLLNRFSQHQVRGWEHGASCCLTACKAADWLRQSHPSTERSVGSRLPKS